MSYDEWRFTFGAKTKAQIDAIPQTYMSLGNSVWNSNLMKPEYVNGYSVSSTCNNGMDVVFLIDYTASMGGAIEDIKNAVTTITNRIISESGNNYRLGLVIYDEYGSGTVSNYSSNVNYTSLPAGQKIVNTGILHPPNTSISYQWITAMQMMTTNNITAFTTQLNKLDGVMPLGYGVEGPEPADVGLAQINSGFAGTFRSGVARMIILVTDNVASGNDDYFNQVDIDYIKNVLTPSLVASKIRVLMMTTSNTNVGLGLESIYSWTGGGSAAPVATTYTNIDVLSSENIYPDYYGYAKVSITTNSSGVITAITVTTSGLGYRAIDTFSIAAGWNGNGAEAINITGYVFKQNSLDQLALATGGIVSETFEPEAIVNAITSTCSLIAGGIRKFVNEDCVMLINNTGATLSEGQVVRISNTGLTDGVSLATSSNDDYLCGVVYRGAANQDVVVVAIQGEYKVKIFAGEATLPSAGKIVTVSTTPGEGDMTGATTGATNNIGVCAETLAAYPSDRLVKCMIQNFQSV